MCEGRLRVGEGSSPLSRGILHKSLTLRVIEGIIPALAGNTFLETFACPVSQDHPRSRGEYSANTTTS